MIQLYSLGMLSLEAGIHLCYNCSPVSIKVFPDASIGTKTIQSSYKKKMTVYVLSMARFPVCFRPSLGTLIPNTIKVAKIKY